MPKLGTRTITGRSGKGYEFNVYPGNMQFNDFIPGVYVICQEEGDECKTLFVGETDNVDRTLQSHEKQAEFDEHGYNRICFHRTANADSRRTVVDDLVPALNPACN